MGCLLQEAPPKSIYKHYNDAIRVRQPERVRFRAKP